MTPPQRLCHRIAISLAVLILAIAIIEPPPGVGAAMALAWLIYIHRASRRIMGGGR